MFSGPGPWAQIDPGARARTSGYLQSGAFSAQRPHPTLGNHIFCGLVTKVARGLPAIIIVEISIQISAQRFSEASEASETSCQSRTSRHSAARAQEHDKTR